MDQSEALLPARIEPSGGKMKLQDVRLFTYTTGPTGPAVTTESPIEKSITTTTTSVEVAVKDPSEPLQFKE